MSTPVVSQAEAPGPGIRYFADEVHDKAWPRFLGRPVLRRRLLVAMGLLTIYVDYLTGATIRFPAFYAVPILLFAWYDGFLWGSATGLVIVGMRFVLERWIWPDVPWPLSHSLLNAFSSTAMTLVIAWFAARAGRLTREVRLLWGLLPICMYCHRIRTQQNAWMALESYIMERSSAVFTHGLCPICLAKQVHEWSTVDYKKEL